MPQARVQEYLNTEHVGDREILRAGDRAVDMGLGGEVDYQVVPGEHIVEGSGVTDIPFDDVESSVGRDRVEIGQVGGVGHLVVDGDPGGLDCFELTAQGHAHVARADEAGATSDEDPHAGWPARLAPLTGARFGCDRRASDGTQPAVSKT